MKRILQTTLATLLFTATFFVSSPLNSIAAEKKEKKAPERAIVTRARKVVLPEFKLEGDTLVEALKKLTDAAKQNDSEGEGFNFMASKPAVEVANPKINLALKNVTVMEAIERLAKAAGVVVEARDYAFMFEVPAAPITPPGNPA